jgi:hypothetical protein
MEHQKGHDMRWIITIDHMGGCLGLGENEDGAPIRGKPEEGDMLPMEFQLFDARGNICFAGRCRDIDEDWWHGLEPLLFAWNTHARCRRLTYRRAGSAKPWRPLRP